MRKIEKYGTPYGIGSCTNKKSTKNYTGSRTVGSCTNKKSAKNYTGFRTVGSCTNKKSAENNEKGSVEKDNIFFKDSLKKKVKN